MEEMIRDAWLLASALRDDSRATQFLHWHRKLESLVLHLEVSKQSQKEAIEAELQDIYREKAQLEERIFELDKRAENAIRSLDVESNTRRPVDLKSLKSLEETFNVPTLEVEDDEVQKQSQHEHPGRMIYLKHAEIQEGPAINTALQDQDSQDDQISLPARDAAHCSEDGDIRRSLECDLLDLHTRELAGQAECSRVPTMSMAQ
jgi:hypothetical protein